MLAALPALLPAVPAFLDVSPGEMVPLVVPIVGCLMILGIVVAVVISGAYTKGRRIEAERDGLARRLAYDQRMKELEVERMRLNLVAANPGAAQTAAAAAAGPITPQASAAAAGPAPAAEWR